MSFSNDQLRAISHMDGPCLVLAGPGSGKTTVITQRILTLLQKGVSPTSILVITFTKAAALEMQERFSRLQRESDISMEGNVCFGTFHSVFFAILCERYHLNQKNIVSEYERMTILRELMEDEHIDSEYDTDFMKQIISELSKAKNSMAADFKPTILTREQFDRVSHAYNEILKEKRLVDFDDMLFRCYKLFLEEPDVLKSWQEQYRYILVDEFQDINEIQYKIVQLLALPENNLFIVGDDDQSIYRFRGARPEIMLHFEEDYKNAVRILLSRNFRSRYEIVMFAGHVIEHNNERFEKKIFAMKGNGGVVRKYLTNDTPTEYALLASNLKRDLRQVGRPGKLAVLYRANTMVRPLLPILIRNEIPYVIKDKVQNIYDHFIAKDFISYIKIALHVGNRADLLRIMNKPLRYISRKAVAGGNISMSSLKSYYVDDRRILKRILVMERDLGMIAELPTAAALIYIKKKLGYDDYLLDYQRENHMGHEQFRDIMDEIISEAEQHPDKEEWLSYIEEYGIALSRAERKSGEQDGVRLMTYHSSKGLEFDRVHLIDSVEGVTPYHKARTAEELEEERRAFYVAATRAREEIHIYVTKERYSKACIQSRFITEGEQKHGQTKGTCRRR